MTDEHRTVVALAAAGKTPMDMSECADENHFFDCETGACAYNHNGQCRYFAVEEEMPTMTEEDGCLSGILESEV